MNSAQHSETSLRASHARLQQSASASGPIVLLHLGDEALALVFGEHEQQLAYLPLGLQTLSQRYLAANRLSPLSVEHAIAEVEDVVMPWHHQLPASAQLFSEDDAVGELARWAGMPGDTPSWRLSTEAVETLFNRWSALVQGRPPSQDPLPSTGRFAAALLMLREWLHHLGFDGITVSRSYPLTDSSV
jgi:hypothetical protein